MSDEVTVEANEPVCKTCNDHKIVWVRRGAFPCPDC